MNALVAAGAGRPDVEAAVIDPPEPGPDELVIAVEAFSVNRGETFVLRRAAAGWRPGKDVAGVVVRAAAGGRGPRAGARVVAHVEGGGWAERVAAPVDRVAVLPDRVGFDVAAALPLAGLTALRLLRVAGPLASRRVLLTGASGGVGHYVVELAASQGARVTAVTASAERGARLLELGAVETVRTVEAAVGPFDVALDSVGGSSTAAALSRLRHDGLLIWFGQAGLVPPTLDFFDWSGGRSATIRKFYYGDSDVPDGEDLATLVRLVGEGCLHPEIGVREPWERTGAVIESLVGRGVRGNAVLTIHAAGGAR